MEGAGCPSTFAGIFARVGERRSQIERPDENQDAARTRGTPLPPTPAAESIQLESEAGESTTKTELLVLFS